jgi:cytidyltransferase-like protein
MSKIEDLILEKFSAYGDVRGARTGLGHGGGGSTNASSGGMRNRGKPPKGTMVPRSFNTDSGPSFEVQEEPLAEAKDPSELPKSMTHIDELKPNDFMDFIRKYAQDGLEISEKIDGSARISFGVENGKLWTQSKNGQRKYSSSEYSDEPMFAALKAAHRALESKGPTIVSSWPDGVDFMVGEVLHTKIPNSIEYGPDAIIIHGVHPHASDPKVVATLVTQAVQNDLDGWRFEYKPTVDPKEFNVDVMKELQRAEIIFRRLQSSPKDKKLQQQFKETQLQIKDKLLGKLRSSRSAYGPEGGDVEGMVFRDLDTGAMTKLVDKDYFTKLNKFLWHWREMLDKGIKVGEEWRPGVMQNFRNIIGDEVLGAAVAKTPGFVRYLVRNYGDVVGSTPVSKADRVLARYIQENNLMSGDFASRFNSALAGVFQEFENLKEQWEQTKAQNPEMQFGEKIRRMDPIIIDRTDKAYQQMEATLEGIKKGMEVANGIGDPLTAKVALLKLMMGPRFNKLVEEMSKREPITEISWKGLAAAGALAAATATGEYTEDNYAHYTPQPEEEELVRPDNVEAWVNQASHETGIQPELIRAIMKVESNLNPHARSGVGAYGYMQLMPGTAAEMRVQRQDPGQNILGGARYLQTLAKRFGGNLAKTVGAYNAGPGGISGKTVDEWPDETRNYLKKVLKHLPRGFNVVKYKPVLAHRQQRVGPVAEGGPVNRSTSPVDLSGKPQSIPDLEDGAMANESLAAVIGAHLRRRLVEDRSTNVGVTVGRFQPFHSGHAAIIRALAAQFPKVVIFVAGQKQGKKNPFSHETRMKLMQASLKDIWSKLEVYPSQIAGKGSGYVPGLASFVAQNYQSTINPSSNITIFVGEDRFEDIQKQIQHNEAHKAEPGYFQGNITAQALKGVSLDDDDAGRISGTRVREALLDDEKDQVRKMLDPNVSTEPAVFEELYAQMRRELGATGSKPVETITDAPVVGPQPEDLAEIISNHIVEMGMGAMETGVGWSRGGAWGSSGWSRAILAKDMTGDEVYQQSLKGGTNRMLDMTNSGTPNDHMPGEELDHHLGPDDEDAPQTLNQPTDLSDAIVRALKNMM